MPFRRLALPAAAAIAFSSLLAGCTATTTPDDEATRVSPPDQAVTTAASADPAARALEVSRALFESSPLAVIAAADDVRAITQAADQAVHSGAPRCSRARPRLLTS